MDDKRPQIEGKIDIPQETKILYWLHFCRKEHRAEMELLLHEGKLSKKPPKGWNNVMKHCVSEAAGMRALSLMLQLPEDEAERLETLAFVHDAKKHQDIMPKDFNASDQEKLNEKLSSILTRVDPDGTLLRATGPEFLYRVFESEGTTIDEKIANVPRRELLQYYIDSIFDEGRIVPVLQRIAIASERPINKKLNEECERTRRLGMKFWDAERLLAIKTQELIFCWLQESGVDIQSPDDVPQTIHRKIEQAMIEKG